MIPYRKVTGFRSLLKALVLPELPERKGRNSGRFALGIGRWQLYKESDYFLKLLANFGIAIGAILMLTSPLSLQTLLVSPSEPNAGDFLMAAGLMVRIALALGAWWESKSPKCREGGLHHSRDRSVR